MTKRYILFITLLIAAFSCTSRNKNNNEKASVVDSIHAKFPIQRGINISHYLSQNPDYKSTGKNIFTENDAIFLSQKGYDHIRLPIDEENLWNESGEKQKDAFYMLHSAIGWCITHQLRVIVDLHIVRAHYFNNKSNLLWESITEKNHFVQLWLQLSDELRKYPVNILKVTFKVGITMGKAKVP